MLLVLASCLAPQNSSTAGWQTVDFNDQFSFRLPPGFVKQSTTAPEDERAEYYKGKTKLVIVWGHTESPAYNERQQAGMNDYHESTLTLRGQPANIRTYWQSSKTKRVYRAELNTGHWEKGEVQLYMRLEGEDSSVVQTGDQIFRSIKFRLPPPERPSRPAPLSPAVHIRPSRAMFAGIS